MKRIITKKINFVEQVKLHSKGGKPIWKTGTCKDHKFI